MGDPSSKRRSRRIACSLAVRWCRRGEPVELQATDISLHGMFLRTRETPMPGSLLQVIAHLPAGDVRMFLCARFVGSTVSGHGIGAEIFLMEEKDRQLWAAHYRTLLAAHPERERRAPPVVLEATAD